MSVADQEAINGLVKQAEIAQYARRIRNAPRRAPAAGTAYRLIYLRCCAPPSVPLKAFAMALRPPRAPRALVHA